MSEAAAAAQTPGDRREPCPPGEKERNDAKMKAQQTCYPHFRPANCGALL